MIVTVIASVYTKGWKTLDKSFMASADTCLVASMNNVICGLQYTMHSVYKVK